MRKTASWEMTTEEDTTLKKTTNLQYQTAYSKVSMLEAEERLGFTFFDFEKVTIPIAQMLVQAKPEIGGLESDQVQQTKEMVFENIFRFIDAEGYPTEFDEDLKEANVNDLVLLIILPILTEMKRKVGHNLVLQREKEILAADSQTRGFQEFVGMDVMGVGDRKFVFVVEAKKSSIGQAKKQCLLVLKDMRDNNGGGIVYGFVTSGGEWQMFWYDSKGFTQTNRFPVLFYTMGHEKERWMKE